MLTRKDNHSVGPCIDERAGSPTGPHADLRVSIHADGGPPSGYGFHVIEPALIRGLTDDIFAASHRLAVDLRDAFTRATGEPFASYVADDGLPARGDLGGLRLAECPRCSSRPATCAAHATRATGQPALPDSRCAGIADGIERFLMGR